MDNVVFVFTLGTRYEIKLDLNERTELGCSIEYSELYRADLIQGLFF